MYELFCGYLQFHDILHVYIIGICSQFERNVITTWDIYNVILKSKEYDSDAYVEWKKRLHTDKLDGDLKLILTEDRPSAFQSSGKDREAYDWWHAASSHVKNILLASVGNSLGWIDKLDTPLIQEPKWFDRVSTKCLMRLVVKTLRKTVLKEDQNISDYVVEMMDGLDRHETLGRTSLRVLSRIG